MHGVCELMTGARYDSEHMLPSKPCCIHTGNKFANHQTNKNLHYFGYVNGRIFEAWSQV
jgi:hypothetical protein